MRRYLLLILSLSFLCAAGGYAQGPNTIEKKALRIVDSLSVKERANRQAVLLRTELDSLIRQYNDSIAGLLPEVPSEPPAKAEMDYELIIVVVSLLIIGLLLYLLLRNQQRFKRTIEALNSEVRELQQAVQPTDEVKIVSQGKQKGGAQSIEKKLQLAVAAAEKAQEENRRLQASVQTLQQQAAEFETVKQLMTQVYKMRNYPGYAKDKTEAEIVKAVMDTERSVAQYAYERFAKPIVVIADTHKNDPARIPAEAQQQMIDNLVSLGLFYSEYLYLRVPELSVGGKIIERIGSIRQQQADLSSLKELNTEHGSRALVLRIALERMGITRLNYPVFDETNLNLS